MYRLLPRACAFFVLAAIVIPTIYYARQYVQATTLYPGDRTELRGCRVCEDGVVPEELRQEWGFRSAICPVCAGQGEVEVIIPGPNRPTTIHGAVVQPIEEGWGYEPPLATSNAALLTPCPGGVPSAKVTIEPHGKGDTIRVVTNSHGRFLTRLPPGDYTVTVRTGAFPEYSEEWTIDPLEATIWLEKAKNVEEPESDAEMFAWHGRSMTLILQE